MVHLIPVFSNKFSRTAMVIALPIYDRVGLNIHKRVMEKWDFLANGLALLTTCFTFVIVGQVSKNVGPWSLSRCQFLPLLFLFWAEVF